MSYTTAFDGAFAINRPLRPEHKAYLLKFAETRRMKRDAAVAARLPDPVRAAAGLPVGPNPKLRRQFEPLDNEAGD
jgi:hypothetical protein